MSTREESMKRAAERALAKELFDRSTSLVNAHHPLFSMLGCLLDGKDVTPLGVLWADADLGTLYVHKRTPDGKKIVSPDGNLEIKAMSGDIKFYFQPFVQDSWKPRLLEAFPGVAQYIVERPTTQEDKK